MTEAAPLSDAAAAALGGVVVLAIAVLYALARQLAANGPALWRRLRPRLAESYVITRSRPLLARLPARFPRLYPAITARLDPRQFRGLPLTLIVVAAAYLALLFFGLVERVLESEGVDALDDLVVGTIAPLRNPRLVRLAAWITQLGSTATLTAVAIAATGFLWSRGPVWGIPTVWIAIAGAQITTWTGKFLIDRTRPDFLLDVTAWSPSFPSGHATGATAVYGILAYVVARDLPSYRRRFDVTFWTAVLIATIASSRVYLSVHYPTDVAAGLLVGGFWLLAGIAAGELLRGRG